MLRLSLTNYRNFKSREIEFSPPTIVLGPNASGKTNILESIFLLATTNSFKNARSQALIRFDADFCKVNLVQPEEDQELEIRIIKNKRQAVKEAYLDQRQVSLADFVGNFKAVVFSPESLHIIKGPPQERRSFLNIALSQANHQYLLALINYQKVKKERNKLLFLIAENQAEKIELEFWNEELIKWATVLIEERFKMVEYFNQTAPKIYQKISQTKDKLKIIYQHSLGREIDHQTKSLQIVERLNQILEESYSKDFKYRTTTKGPHRDELKFQLNDHKAMGSASQGEIRSISFSLKMTEAQFLKQETNSLVKLLLDDPLSELDHQRGGQLLGLAKEEKAIISALPAEIPDLSQVKKDFQIIETIK